jgi:carboxypeptidase Q
MPPDLDLAVRLRDAALVDSLAYELTAAIGTELGLRLAGTPAEARARDWAVAKLKALGFPLVRVEPFEVPVWFRGTEQAEIVHPCPQPLVVTALGNSGATPPEGLVGEVFFCPDLAALEAAGPEQIRGRIVYVSHGMTATRDGSGYGRHGPVRWRGPSLASAKGATAILIRSVGTNRHRHPHTGVMRFTGGAAPIPAAALSLADADQLERVIARGQPVNVRLVLTPRDLGTGPSGNVIAEFPGTDPSAGVVLVAGHLDSWDLSTGSSDNAAGCAIVASAALRVAAAGRPRRTIRVVWFGAEEIGLMGGHDYVRVHGAEKHAMIAESDLGADRVWRFDSRAPASAQPAVRRIAEVLAPLGIEPGPTDRAGGSDIGPLCELGVSTIELRQDATRYFSLHHTADDTLDQVDPEALRQNVAAWTAMLAIVAHAPEELASPPSGTASDPLNGRPRGR